MKFGVPLGMLNPSAWVDVSVAADELGFDSVWIPEHLVLPDVMAGSPHAGADHPPVPPDIPVFDALVYLSHIAARTTNVRLGTHVYNIGLRHPFVTARAAATLDIVSNGRLLFGIGASWLREEWDAAQLDFATRGARVDEAIEICLRLWEESRVEFHGRHFDFGPVAFEPKPVQRPIPLVIGGDGPAALRRAATVGAGWIPMNHSLEQLPAARDKLVELRERAGRSDPVEITFGAGVVADALDIEQYAAAGVDRLLVRPWQRTRDAVESLARFAKEVMA
jgi:probable F420-dependent oxidoreductase